MTQAQFLLLALLGELAVILFCTGAVLAYLNLRRRKQVRRAMQRLIDNVKRHEAQRRKETAQWLADTFGYAGQELDRLLQEMHRRERDLYQAFIGLYLNRDLEAAASFDAQVGNVTEPFRRLRRPAAGTAAQAASPPAASQEATEQKELLALRDRNQRLAEELHITQETIDKMLTDYTSMSDHKPPAGKNVRAPGDAQTLAATER